MKMNWHFATMFLGAALAFGPSATWSQQTAPPPDSPKQDLKDAGRDTAQAARDTGHGVKQGTKKAYHSTKNGTKKAWNKTKNTTTGAVDGAKQGAKQPD
jgi:hypothetical protein